MSADRVRVLLVDDDEDDSLLIRRLLSRAQGQSFVLDWVTDYDAAREGICGRAHDVYLLDYRLGEHNGLELLREAVRHGCKGPFILLTGQGDRAVDLEAMEAGAADYLVKGQIDAPLLERAIRYAVERRRSADALQKARDELELRVAERTRELSQANALLAEAARRKDEFLAMLGHELRNPLAPLRTGLYLLRRGDTDDRSRVRVGQMMERQVTHLARLVDDLLDVGRITWGRVTLHRERLDLAEAVRAATEDRRPLVEAAGLRLTVEVPVGPVPVWADATRLAQVVNNLLDNAVKFTPRGGRAAVRVGVEDGPGQALLSVRDTGVGIEAGLLPRLFDAFSQGDRSLDRTKGGLGLGLALVKGLVELHGGTVEARSDGPERGAEFVVRLPLEQVPPAEAEAPAGARPAAQRLRVLVVEDNQDAADSLRLLLEMSGYEARVAYTGPDGVRAAREWRPEVIVCDIGLPGLDGYGVARALRRDPTTAGARLIAVTGYGQDEDRRHSAEAGFDLHLTKPVDPDILVPLLARPEGG